MGNVTQTFSSFSWRIFSHVTRFDCMIACERKYLKECVIVCQLRSGLFFYLCLFILCRVQCDVCETCSEVFLSVTCSLRFVCLFVCFCLSCVVGVVLNSLCTGSPVEDPPSVTSLSTSFFSALLAAVRPFQPEPVQRQCSQQWFPHCPMLIAFCYY